VIPLSFIGTTTDLSGTWLYFPNLLPAGTPTSNLYLGSIDGRDDSVVFLSIRIENSNLVLKLLYQQGDREELICDVQQFFGKYNYIRSVQLPYTLKVAQTIGREDLYLYSFVMVKRDIQDSPVPEILNPMGVKYELAVESMLSDVIEGDDLTNKVIVFDRTTFYTGITQTYDITLGNIAQPGSTVSTPDWSIRARLTSTDASNTVSSWVRNTATELYKSSNWIQNHVDLISENGNEKFIVTEFSPADLSALSNAYICRRIQSSLSMTALDIVGHAANRLHMPRPTTLVVTPSTYENTSDAQNAVLLLAALNQAVRNLAVVASWSQLIKVVTFNATEIPDNGYSDIIGGFDLDIIAPSYDGITSSFMYVPSLKKRVIHVSDEDFMEMKYAPSTDNNFGYKIYANHLCFTGEIKALVTFLYKTRLAVRSMLGESKETIDLDTDMCYFDSEALILGTMMYFKNSIGQDTTAEGNLYGSYVKHLQSKMGAPGIVVDRSDRVNSSSQFNMDI
jgi:hypothetical protein